MIQKSARPPNIYALFSTTPTSMLEAATRELSRSVDAGYINEPNSALGHILELIRTPVSTEKLPYVQIGYSSQLQLVNALTSCLSPAEVRFKSSGNIAADTKTRLLALDALIEIEDIASDRNSDVIASIGNVGSIIPKIIVHDMTDSQLIEAYHERLMGWPPFVREFGAQYEDALNQLYQRSIKRGHCDEMTMGWVRTAKRHLHTVQFMGSNGTVLNCKPT